MEGLPTKIHEYLTDSKKSIGHKFGYVLSISAILLIGDYFFNISYTLHQSNKLSNLEKISRIKQNHFNDSLLIQNINKLQLEVIESPHYYDKFNSYWLSLSELVYRDNVTPSKVNTLENKSPKLSIILTALSSSAIFILLCF